MSSGCRVRTDGHTCGRQVKARGLCLPHYNRWISTGDVKAHEPVRGRPKESVGKPAPKKDRRARLRDILIGTDPSSSGPFCGQEGCICPPLREVERILEAIA